MRNQLKMRVSLTGSDVGAYIVTSYDEHQNEDVAEWDKRRQYLTGFTGTIGDAVVCLYDLCLHFIFFKSNIFNFKDNTKIRGIMDR